jgi:hypothetical protein
VNVDTHREQLILLSCVVHGDRRDFSRVRVGLVGARQRRHKVAGEQVGGTNEAVDFDVVGVAPGVPPQPVAECAVSHGGEFADTAANILDKSSSSSPSSCVVNQRVIVLKTWTKTESAGFADHQFPSMPISIVLDQHINSEGT